MTRKELARQKAFTEIDVLSEQSNKLLICLPTGYGKTFMAIQLLQKYIISDRCLWIVPNTDLIDNAKDEFIKHGYEYLISRTTFICYASVKNYVNAKFDVVVCDEIHNAYSDIRSSSIKSLQVDKMIGLSATISQEIQESLNTIGEWNKYTKTLKEAFEEGVLVEPEIIYVNVVLNDKIERNKYYSFYHKKELMGTDACYYRVLSEEISSRHLDFKYTGNKFAEIEMKRLGGLRQKFLAEKKESRVRDLINFLGDKRFICFANSIEQAKRLGKNVCSSERSKKGNKELIDKFNAKEINNLFAKNMLKEGTNLTDTDYGILIQPGNNEKDFIQMLGRTLRSDKPVFYIFRIKDTVDDRFLRTSTRQLNN